MKFVKKMFLMLLSLPWTYVQHLISMETVTFYSCNSESNTTDLGYYVQCLTFKTTQGLGEANSCIALCSQNFGVDTIWANISSEPALHSGSGVPNCPSDTKGYYTCTCTQAPTYSYNNKAIIYYQTTPSSGCPATNPIPVNTSEFASPTGWQWAAGCAQYSTLTSGYLYVESGQYFPMSSKYVLGTTSGGHVYDFAGNLCSTATSTSKPSCWVFTYETGTNMPLDSNVSTLCSYISQMDNKSMNQICNSSTGTQGTTYALSNLFENWKPTIDTDFVDLDGNTLGQALLSQNSTLVQNALQYAIPLAISQVYNLVNTIQQSEPLGACENASSLIEVIQCSQPQSFVDTTKTPAVTYTQTAPTCTAYQVAHPETIGQYTWYTSESCVQADSYQDAATGIVFWSTPQNCANTSTSAPTTLPGDTNKYEWYPACTTSQQTGTAQSSSTSQSSGTSQQTGTTQSSSSTPIPTTKFALTAESSWPSAQTLKTKKEIICELGTINHKKVCMTTTAATCKNFSKAASTHSSNPGCGYKATVAHNGAYGITHNQGLYSIM